MTTKELKYEIIELVSKTEDEELLYSVKESLENKASTDWWDTLGENDKEDIDRSLEEAENDQNFIPYQTFKEEFDQWRTQLLSSKGST